MFKGGRALWRDGHVRADGLEEETRPVVYYSCHKFRSSRRQQWFFAPLCPRQPDSRNCPAHQWSGAGIRCASHGGAYRREAGDTTRAGGSAGNLRRDQPAAATIGMYGVIAQVVAERTQEIGVRMAMGARPAQILRQFLGQGMRAAAFGLVVGALLTVYIRRWIAACFTRCTRWIGRSSGLADCHPPRAVAGRLWPARARRASIRKPR